MKTRLTIALMVIAIITTDNLQQAIAQNNFPSSGNVGIGTTSPGAPLDIKSTTSGRLVCFNGTSNRMWMGIYENSKYRGYIGSYSGNNEDVDFGTGIGTTGKLHLTIQASPKLTIDNTGNVGIGTTAPTKRLYVASPGSYTEDNTSDGDALIVRANGSGACFGVNASSVNSYGVYTYSISSYGIFACTSNASSYAGYFNGNIFTTGCYQGSDSKLKQNITDFASAMNVINKLQPKTYEYRQDGNFKLMHLPGGKHYGLIAQDVEQVLPDLVKESEFNAGKETSSETKTSASAQSGTAKGEAISFKALNYVELIPIMIKAMQELSKQNEDLQKQINELKTAKAASSPSSVSSQSVTKIMLTNASIDQNSPNPFAGATSIRYSLPAGFKAAQIIVTDNSGKTIKQVQLNTKGDGTVNIDAAALGSGTYNYTLVVDGRIIESKKMVVAH